MPKYEDARTQAMILLTYDAAMRREELISLRVDDIDWSRGIITIRPETTKEWADAAYSHLGCYPASCTLLLGR